MFDLKLGLRHVLKSIFSRSVNSAKNSDPVSIQERRFTRECA